MVQNENMIDRTSSMPAPVNAEHLMAADLPGREAILDPLLARGSLVLLYGPRGLGKTFVALAVARAVASGGTFLKWQAPQPRRVLYIDGEMPACVRLWLKAHEVNRTPRSLCITRPLRSGRRCVAIPSALSTRLVVWVESIDQPTTCRLKVSSTTQQ